MRGVAASAKRRSGPAGIPLGVELYRRFDGQPRRGSGVFTVGMKHWGPPPFHGHGRRGPSLPLEGQYISGGLTNILDDSKASYPNPLGIFPQHGWFGGFVAAVVVATFAAALCAVASVFARRRGASPELRKQLAWLGYVGIVTVFWILVLGTGAAIHPDGNNALGTVLWVVMVLTPAVGIPVACVVAVLKYRLYDIDRVISRTVSYAIVTGLLVGVYAGLVLLATHVLSFRTPVAVAASTLAAAALFSPARRWVQRAVDRRFNRARYDADQTVSAFAARLKDAVDLDSVQADLAQAVSRALEPAHLSVWVSHRD